MLLRFIFYLLNLFLQYKLTFTKDHYSRKYTIEDVVKKNDYHIIDAQKWQYVHMLNKVNLGSFLPEQSMKLSFEFKEIYNIKVDYDVPEVQLSNDFENLLNSSIFSDVTLKSAEKIEYKVHKVVLASRSKVLRAHFEHNTTECILHVVESPLESDVLQEVINFIYTDKASRVDEIPEKLLEAADYYQLSRLKSLCEMALYKKLTVENAIEILQLADLHSATDLKQWTLEFIKDDQSKLITKTDAWADAWAKIESVQVIKTICEYINAGQCDNRPHFNKKITLKNI